LPRCLAAVGCRVCLSTVVGGSATGRNLACAWRWWRQPSVLFVLRCRYVLTALGIRFICVFLLSSLLSLTPSMTNMLVGIKPIDPTPYLFPAMVALFSSIVHGLCYLRIRSRTATSLLLHPVFSFSSPTHSLLLYPPRDLGATFSRRLLFPGLLLSFLVCTYDE